MTSRRYFLSPDAPRTPETDVSGATPPGSGSRACGLEPLRVSTACAATIPSADALAYLKRVYDYLESTAPAGFADEAFRLPPSATGAERAILDHVQGDASGERAAAARPDQGLGQVDRSAVAAYLPAQAPLEPEFANVLFGNLDALYATDELPARGIVTRSAETLAAPSPEGIEPGHPKGDAPNVSERGPH